VTTAGRPLRVGAITLAAILLTGAFMYLRFPYDRLADAVAVRVERASGWRLQITGLGPHPMLLGPGLSAGPIRAQHADGTSLAFDAARARPAWSLAWLGGRPALYVEIEGPLFSAAGTLVLGDAPSFEGRLQDADLNELPLQVLDPQLQITGRVDADISVAMEPAGMAGPIALAAREGSFSHPGLPLAIPYDAITGELEFGGDHWLTVHRFDIQSPLLTGQVRGTVGPPPTASLDLEMELVPGDAARAALYAQGVRVDPDGTLSLRLGGTASHPVVQ